MVVNIAIVTTHGMDMLICNIAIMPGFAWVLFEFSQWELYPELAKLVNLYGKCGQFSVEPIQNMGSKTSILSQLKMGFAPEKRHSNHQKSP